MRPRVLFLSIASKQREVNREREEFRIVSPARISFKHGGAGEGFGLKRMQTARRAEKAGDVLFFECHNKFLLLMK